MKNMLTDDKRGEPKSDLKKSHLQTNVWKSFLDKTSDCKFKRTDNNYSSKRTLEEFLSSRTINPTKFSSQAQLMMMKSEKELRKAEHSINSKGDVEEELTGCKRAVPKYRK
eukprot:CAMPEP_0170557658 /NCGR_PEP_ID=MMETSP0211-20121228/28924_1 /TAXON_ID=311385 /ORGANISM="Pseudokeronopsis sp., Strain OXSARD2" /LENGTH=110 /DNA_ID=CAMNT_0010868871 /DNA_START=348 /DNA_END=680 /DNA_ORIENTATION=+